ncbi:hypothetical protein F511_44226 [Dorcoceras hygrometricum]|uniref:Uncharacterized protein n=1 Tax=Dorcoceras hygrometricum TaxID=472368 RepID=A0A2Z6ZYR8_9LAMI|nr:hypothetical protein F511_44226 [Dorcoceras hygrometricum]
MMAMIQKQQEQEEQELEKGLSSGDDEPFEPSVPRNLPLEKEHSSSFKAAHPPTTDLSTSLTTLYLVVPHTTQEAQCSRTGDLSTW